MQRLCVCTLILVLALATFSDASWKPRSQLRDTPSGPETNRDLDPHQLDQLGPVSHHRRQLGRQRPPHLIELSKKQGPWMEEEEAYGWMDFGRRSAEEGDQRP